MAPVASDLSSELGELAGFLTLVVWFYSCPRLDYSIPHTRTLTIGVGNLTGCESMILSNGGNLSWPGDRKFSSRRRESRTKRQPEQDWYQ